MPNAAYNVVGFRCLESGKWLWIGPDHRIRGFPRAVLAAEKAGRAVRVVLISHVDEASVMRMAAAVRRIFTT